MATVLLGAAGASFATGAGGLGLTAGSFAALAVQGAFAAVGSIIDSAWIGRMFKPGDTHGPRIHDLQIQGVDEGTPINRAYGPTTRCAGQIIWTSNLLHETNSHSQSKGGSGGNFIVNVYRRHIDLALCEDGREVIKLWADGNVIYDLESVPDDVTTDQVSGTVTLVTFENEIPDLFGAGVTYLYTFTSELLITAPAGGADLSKFVENEQLSMTGFTGGATVNNGLFDYVLAGTNLDGSTFVRVKRISSKEFATQQLSPVPDAANVLIAFSLGAHTVTMSQTESVTGWLERSVRSIRFYSGGDTQLQDALEVASNGANATPAYRGVTRVVLEGLLLTDFGNRIPMFSGLVRHTASNTLEHVVFAEFDRRGLSSDIYDATRLTMPIAGVLARGALSFRQVMSPLLVAYSIVVAEVEGKFIFYPRDQLPTYTIDPALLGASDGSRVPDVVELETTREELLPTEVVVSFMDPANDYQVGVQRARKQSAEFSVVEELDLPIVIGRGRGMSIAQRVLWSSDGGSKRYRFTLPMSELGRVTEAMLVTVEIGGFDRTLLVQRVERSSSGLLEVTAIEEEQSLLALTDEDGTLDESTDDFAPALLTLGQLRVEAFVFDIGPLRDAHARELGLYLACGLPSQTSQFSGASWFESDDDVSWRRVVDIQDSCSHGISSNSLAIWTGASGEWDRTSTLTVQMAYGSLESCSDIECLNGKNRMRVGGEVIGFATATSTGTENEYVISDLLRGLVDTVGAWHPTSTGEVVLMLDGPGVVWHPINQAALDRPRYFRALASGQTIDDVESIAVAPTGKTCRPFKPCHLTITRDASNNASIHWTPRTRTISRLITNPTYRDLESTEGYVVEVYADDTFATLVRELRVDEAEVEYTAAQQTSDGLTPGDDLALRVYQVGSIVVRGNVLQAVA